MSVWYQVLEANCNEVTLAQDLLSVTNLTHHTERLRRKSFILISLSTQQEKEGVLDNEQSSRQICQKWSNETVHLKNEIHDTSS